MVVSTCTHNTYIKQDGFGGEVFTKVWFMPLVDFLRPTAPSCLPCGEQSVCKVQCEQVDLQSHYQERIPKQSNGISLWNFFFFINDILNHTYIVDSLPATKPVLQWFVSLRTSKHLWWNNQVQKGQVPVQRQQCQPQKWALIGFGCDGEQTIHRR